MYIISKKEIKLILPVIIFIILIISIYLPLKSILSKDNKQGVNNTDDKILPNKKDNKTVIIDARTWWRRWSEQLAKMV